ncbi:MAG: AAA family ATPase [Actinobacteria bacterium]|nr:AAA family ATPase [Actinomycetota bacterium]
MQEAVNLRHGVSKIRCLSARMHSDIEIEIHISDDSRENVKWKYAIGFTQKGGGVFQSRAKLKYERVYDENDTLVLNRPNNRDRSDERLLEYTFLEQPNSNAAFREISDFLQDIQYLHVLPQLLREPDSFLKAGTKDDFYGRNLIERINRINSNTRHAYFRRIQEALISAVPQFEKLELVKDEMGVPHLQAIYQHWRAKGAKQWEDQFSDGTLRLIGFLWSLLDGTKPLLLEEPELSLHSFIVSRLAEIIAKLQKKKFGNRQVILSTHSAELLSSKGIAGEEVIMLKPTTEGTEAINASSVDEIRILLKSGMNIGDIVIHRTAPGKSDQLAFQFAG